MANDGGSAFPCDEVQEIYRDGEYHKERWLTKGMSLRDYFAAQSIRGGADSVCDQLDPINTASDEAIAAHCERHAKAAYMLADAMLKAREAHER